MLMHISVVICDVFYGGIRLICFGVNGAIGFQIHHRRLPKCASAPCKNRHFTRLFVLSSPVGGTNFGLDSIRPKAQNNVDYQRLGKKRGGLLRHQIFNIVVFKILFGQKRCAAFCTEGVQKKRVVEHLRTVGCGTFWGALEVAFRHQIVVHAL